MAEAATRERAVVRTGIGMITKAGGFVGAQNLSLLVALGLLAAVISSQTPYFFLWSNILNIGVAVSLLGLVAIVQMIVLVSGGLDLSVGSTAGLSSVTAASVVVASNSATLGVLSGLAMGAAAGLFNGFLITAGRVNPVIATLATFSAFRGLAFIVTGGQAIGVSNDTFNHISSGRIGGFPIPVIILIVGAGLFFVLLRFIDIGRNIYAMGGNPVAARLAGINLTRYRFGIYTLSGLVAGLAGVLLTAKINSGQPASGTVGLELDSITAALLGGAALAGGRGTVAGAILGVLILGVLDNGLILLNVQSFYQLVAKGGLLVTAVMIQEWRGHLALPGWSRRS